jgi:hypothetical protein
MNPRARMKEMICAFQSLNLLELRLVESPHSA